MNGITFNGTLNGIPCNGICKGIQFDVNFIAYGLWYFEQYLTKLRSMVIKKSNAILNGSSKSSECIIQNTRNNETDLLI